MRRSYRLATKLCLTTLALAPLACDGGSDEPAAEPVRKAEVVGKAVEAEKPAPKPKGPVVEDGGDPSKPVVRAARECKKAGPDSECCDFEFGLDPQAVADSCGYASYLGEHRTLTSCQYRFDAGRDTPAALTLALFEDQDYAASVEHHMSGFYGLADGKQVPKPGQVGKVHYSGLEKLAWAWVDGWSAPRRVAWSQKECPQDKLESAFEAMSTAPEPSRVVPRVAYSAEARPLPAASGDGAGEKGSLLERYVDRELTKVEGLALPTKSMRLVVMLLERAAKDSTQDFDKLFSKTARRGLPDRRFLRSRSLMGADAGYTFLTDFRAAAQRFGHDAKFACPPLTPSDTKLVVKGEVGMWCTYMSEDQKDIMVFLLVSENEEAKIDYVGFLETAPDGALRADGEPPPPPVRVSDAERADKRAESLNRPDAVHLNPAGPMQQRPLGAGTPGTPGGR